MSSAETLYTFRDFGPNFIEVGRQQVTTLEVYRDGALVAPTESGSTYTLVAPDGTTTIYTSAVTVVGSVARATIPAANIPATLDLGEMYREDWLLVLPDGTTRTKRREAALVRRALNPVVTDLDLLGEYPDIDRDLPPGVTSWQWALDEAWKQIMSRMRQSGTYAYLVFSDTALRDAHRHLAFYLIFKWFHRYAGQSGNWLALMQEHRQAYEAAYTAMSVTVDADHDGVVDGESRSGLKGMTYINASPRRTLARSRWW